MKIEITENKIDNIAKGILTKKLSNLGIVENNYVDSMGDHKTLTFDDGDGNIMIWSDNSGGVLYICKDVTDLLDVIYFPPQKIKKLVGEWVSETYDLPVYFVHHVDKGQLN